MPIMENDLELLDLWLDGELPEAEVGALRQRLLTETELAQTLDRLRADRQLRSHVFQVLEPEEQETLPLLADLRRAMRKDDLWSSRARTLRHVTKIAAAIALVFTAGWISRDRLRVAPAPTDQPAMQQASALPRTANPNMQVVSMPADDDGHIRFFNNGLELRPSQAPPSARPGQVYLVQMIDPSSGQIIGSRAIDIGANPQQFFEQFGRLQQIPPQRPQLQPQPPSSPLINVDSPQQP